MSIRSISTSLVLLLIVLTILPGICYSASSSITSYNNAIPSFGSDSPVIIPPGSGFELKDPVDVGGGKQYEVVLDGKSSFLGDKNDEGYESTRTVDFQINADMKFAIYLKVGNSGKSSNFELTVSQGQSKYLDKCPFSSNKSGGSEGYVNVSGRGQGLLVSLSSALIFPPMSSVSTDDFKITVTGTSNNGEDIHISILITSDSSTPGSVS